ncbi:unnamed protein product [Ranitomeya imitator]|uniref:Uncharacterized protein n=1 Tax=Ranitomeya imitator TaxID=111125 RepID=A0ABN9LDR2_9NEOB|nr:unnamed protein product [Ranitomeya imitator]
MPRARSPVGDRGSCAQALRHIPLVLLADQNMKIMSIPPMTLGQLISIIINPQWIIQNVMI